MKFVVKIAAAVTSAIISIFSPASFCALSYCNSESVALTAVMYHSVLNSQKGSYIVSVKSLESDLIAYKNAGYTTVLPSEIVGYCLGTTTLPEKPLLLTFDDGQYNVMHYALPLLIKYNMKAAVTIIGIASDKYENSPDAQNPNFAALTWSDIKKLSNTGVFEIGSHTYDMHKEYPRFGIRKMKNESNDEYYEVLREDFTKVHTKLIENSDVNANFFAYPYGAHSETAEKVLKELGYKMTLTCREEKAVITKGDFESLYNIGRFNRDGSYSTEKFIKKISGTT